MECGERCKLDRWGRQSDADRDAADHDAPPDDNEDQTDEGRAPADELA